MNWFEKFLISLQTTMERPHSYGWFHFMFVAIMIAGTVLICIFGKNAKSKTFRIIVGVSWVVMILLEIYKQLVFSISLDGENVVWNYQWYAFPYQLCSTPLYLLPFVVFMKEGKVRDSVMSFISTFAMFGGLVTFVYPEQVFVSTIGINIQTMIHHGLQIVLGVYFMVYNRKKLNWMYFVKGLIVFAIMTAIAQLLNIIVYHALTKTIGETFNMFYISPYYSCTLPLLGDLIYPNVPYAAFLIIYILGFAAAGAVMFAIQYYLIKLFLKLYVKKHNQQTVAVSGDSAIVKNFEINENVKNENSQENVEKKY